MESNGTRPRIEELVDRHSQVLYRFGYRLTGSEADAEDLVQETFLVAQQKLHQLRDGDRALVWLLRILRSCRTRQFRRQVTIDPVSVEEIAQTSSEPDPLADEFDTDRLLATLDRMPEEFRESLILFYFRQLRYREIADLLECPIGTVMSRIARGKAYLRSRLVPERVEEKLCAKRVSQQ